MEAITDGALKITSGYASAIVAAAKKDLLGRKSGKGFYLYRGKGKQIPNPQITNLRSTAMSAENAPSAFDILHRPLLSTVNEAALRTRPISGCKLLSPRGFSLRCAAVPGAPGERSDPSS